MRTISEIDADLETLLNVRKWSVEQYKRYEALGQEKIKAETSHPGPWTERKEKVKK